MKYKQFTMTIQLINEIENIDQYIDDIFEMTQIQILPRNVANLVDLLYANGLYNQFCIFVRRLKKIEQKSRENLKQIVNRRRH